jgi:hypothetical protein
MVRALDCYWNQFVASLHLMQGRLADLGLVLVNAEVI